MEAPPLPQTLLVLKVLRGGGLLLFPTATETHTAPHLDGLRGVTCAVTQWVLHLCLNLTLGRKCTKTFEAKLEYSPRSGRSGGAGPMCGTSKITWFPLSEIIGFSCPVSYFKADKVSKLKKLSLCPTCYLLYKKVLFNN